MPYLEEQRYYLFVLVILFTFCISVCGIAVWQEPKNKWIRIILTNFGLTNIIVFYTVMCAYISQTSYQLAFFLLALFVVAVLLKVVLKFRKKFD